MPSPLPVRDAFGLLPVKKSQSITLGRVYARLYPIRERTVSQLVEQFRCSPTLIRNRLEILQRFGLVESVLKPGKNGRPTQHFTRKIGGINRARLAALCQA